MIIGIVISVIYGYTVWLILMPFEVIRIEMGSILDLLPNCIIWVMVIYFYLNTPDLYDVFFVKNEIKRIFFAFFIIMMRFVVTAVYHAYDEAHKQHSTKSGYHILSEFDWDLTLFSLLFIAFGNVIPQMFIVYTSTFWVLHNRRILQSLNNLEIGSKRTYISVMQSVQQTIDEKLTKSNSIQSYTQSQNSMYATTNHVSAWKVLKSIKNKEKKERRETSLRKKQSKTNINDNDNDNDTSSKSKVSNSKKSRRDMHASKNKQQMEKQISLHSLNTATETPTIRLQLDVNSNILDTLDIQTNSTDSIGIDGMKASSLSMMSLSKSIAKSGDTANSNTSKNGGSARDKSKREKKRVNLESVLKYAETLNLFVVHLTNEFSIELLASYVEFNQFLRLYQDFVNNGYFKFDNTQLTISKITTFTFFTFPNECAVPYSNIIKQEIIGMLEKHPPLLVYFKKCPSIRDIQHFDLNKVKGECDPPANIELKNRGHGDDNSLTQAMITDKDKKTEKEKEKEKQNKDQSDNTQIENVNSNDTAPAGVVADGDHDHEISSDHSKVDATLCKEIMRTETLEMFDKIGKALYLKYIQVGSNMEINISSGLRNDCYHFFERRNNDNDNINGKIMTLDDMNDIIILYRSCVTSMKELLQFAFNRFIRLQNVNILQHELYARE